MPLQKNEGTIDEQVTLLGSLFDAGTLEIRTGPQPGDPNSGASGTLLCTITIPNPAFGAPTAGVISKSGTWSATAVASGTAGYARFISSDTLKTMDAVVTMVPGGNDLLINNVEIVIGNTVTVVSLTLAEPEA